VDSSSSTTYPSSNGAPAASPLVLRNYKKVYELRKYSIAPHLFGSFVKLTQEKLHLRLAHSRLLFYGAAEFGGVNEVHHLWQYDSLDARAAVRAKLATDTVWQSEYVAKAFPMIQHQTNSLLYPEKETWQPPAPADPALPNYPEATTPSTLYELRPFYRAPSTSPNSTMWGDFVVDLGLRGQCLSVRKFDSFEAFNAFRKLLPRFASVQNPTILIRPLNLAKPA